VRAIWQPEINSINSQSMSIDFDIMDSVSKIHEAKSQQKLTLVGKCCLGLRSVNGDIELTQRRKYGQSKQAVKIRSSQFDGHATKELQPENFIMYGQPPH
jgi:hypothetical protein